MMTYSLSLKIQELGSASLQNYLHLVSTWFGDVLSGYNFYLMPLSFFRNFNEAPGVSLNSNERKVLEYIKRSEEGYDNSEDVGDYNLTLRIDVKFQKVKSTSGSSLFRSLMIQVPPQFIYQKKISRINIRGITISLVRGYQSGILISKMNNNYHEIRKNWKEIRNLRTSGF